MFFLLPGDKDVPVTLAPIGSDADEDGDVETSGLLQHSPVPLSNGLSQFPHYTDSKSTEALVTHDLNQAFVQGHANPGFLDNSSQELHGSTLTDTPVAPPRYKKRTATSRRGKYMMGTQKEMQSSGAIARSFVLIKQM